MGITPHTFFRIGKSNSAKLDVLRPGEVVIHQLNGVDIVAGRSGGVSVYQIPNGLRGKWWQLAAGTPYNDVTLFLWNDYDDHWSWEPAYDMPLSEYLSALAAVNAEFIPV